ncbi:MAG TPA: family 16 glycoside hydrolase [Burkholderiales bacterium]|nr:family 16 glycoside hydrolase [Burkholderiales bacterium]
MKILLAGVFLMNLITTSANAQTENFDKAAVGVLPDGWKCGVTGRGSPRWQIEADTTAPSKPNVLKQAGRGDFPWCVKDGVSVKDGSVEVKFKSISGKEDQAGGIVWRWKNGDNYYVARANALENNVSLYYTESGSRKTIKYVDAPVPGNVWHTLRVNFIGTKIEVMLDGKRYIQLDDSHITAAGAVGVWTKADSVTAFDDFVYGAFK